MMLRALCRCGKILFGSEAMAGESARCSLCGRDVTFPGLGVATVAGTEAADDEPDVEPSTETAPTAPATALRSARDHLYWVLLVALLPLIPGLLREPDPRILDRLEETVRAHPEVGPRVDEIMEDPDATLDELLKALPGHRLDAKALLPRESLQQWWHATISAISFLILLRFLFAQEGTRVWKLILIALFTSTVGVVLLFLLEGMVEASFRRALEPERSFLVNLLGYTCGVGLCEELCKALPLFWYVRRRERPTWQGACLWGMASGVGFGVAEGITYSSQLYNGVAGAEPYFTRFVSCVTLHAVWSASVGLALYPCRGMLRRALGTALDGGMFHWQELGWPLLRILGVAMLLHGLYDALLTKDMVAPALLVALLSFAWLGWQIETCRERDTARSARTHTATQPAATES